MEAEKLRSLIQSMNKIKFFGLRQYKMGTALGVPLDDGILTLNWRRAFRSLLFGCLLSDYDIQISGRGKLAFLFSPNYMDRKLFRDDFSGIVSLVKNCRIASAHRKKEEIDPSKIFYAVFYPIWLLQMSGFPLSLMEKIDLVGRMASCRKWALAVIPKIIDKHVSVLTTFCDAHMYDNISAQYCRLNSIYTVTLQHGLYYRATALSFESTFELSVSDKLLLWGNDTKKEALLSGINPKHLYVAGTTRPVKKLARIPETDVFGVMLSGSVPYSEKINSRLIKLANELSKRTGLKYIVREHPTPAGSCRHLYKKEFLSSVSASDTSISDMANKIKFFICVSTSSIAYELLNIGAVVFVHENPYENYYSSTIKNLCFQTIDGLLKLIRWSNENKAEYRQVADDINRDVFSANTLDSYRLFFEEYLE